MPDVRGIAAAYGVGIELTDLGDWGSANLVAEYDPDGPVIRVNERALPHGSSCGVRDAIDLAIAHELYHHREAIGEIPRIAERTAREAAADAFAADLVSTVSPHAGERMMSPRAGERTMSPRAGERTMSPSAGERL